MAVVYTSDGDENHRSVRRDRHSAYLARRCGEVARTRIGLLPL